MGAQGLRREELAHAKLLELEPGHGGKRPNIRKPYYCNPKRWPATTKLGRAAKSLIPAGAGDDVGRQAAESGPFTGSKALIGQTHAQVKCIVEACLGRWLVEFQFTIEHVTQLIEPAEATDEFPFVTHQQAIVTVV